LYIKRFILKFYSGTCPEVLKSIMAKLSKNLEKQIKIANKGTQPNIPLRF